MDGNSAEQRSLVECDFFRSAALLDKSMVFGSMERPFLDTVPEEEHAGIEQFGQITSDESAPGDSGDKVVLYDGESSRRPNLIDVEREQNGWVRRQRHGAMLDERAASAERITALESAFRGFAERKTESVLAPAIGLTFDSIGEAYDFYNLYSWECGFGIRYGKSRTNVKGARSMQEFLCNCSGKPKKQNTSSIRTECPSMIRFLRTDDNGWFICECRITHNHQLMFTCAQKLHFPSHRHIDKYTRDLVSQLRENNVNLSKVYSIIGTFFGRIENVPFTKRCIRTLCGKLSHEQADEDVKKTMDIFSEMKDNDPEFTYSVKLTITSKASYRLSKYVGKYPQSPRKKRLWFWHEEPRVLKLTGVDIFEILNPNGKMNYVGFDMFSRISAEAEHKWAVHYIRSRWRHILHPMFAGSVLHGANAWEKKQINDLFVGSHLRYDVETCRMFFAPYMEDDKTWVIYAFDMACKTVHVLDPRRSAYGVQRLEEHHLSKCIVLVNGMARCMNSFFDGINMDTS